MENTKACSLHRSDKGALKDVLQISAAEVVEDANMGSAVNEGFFKMVALHENRPPVTRTLKGCPARFYHFHKLFPNYIGPRIAFRAYAC